MESIKSSNSSIKKTGIIAKRSVIGRLSNINNLIRLLKSYGVDIYLDKNAGEKLKKKDFYTRSEILNICDLVIILGGDGTVLNVASQTSEKKTLIFPVNYGTLGFLSSSEPKDLNKKIKRVLEGDYLVETRSLLRVTHYRKQKEINTFLALNEAVMNQGVSARLIELKIEVDKREMVSFKADGLIISTPTGSTAHSLSAGGPIVHPSLDALIITPICPAPLTLRPIVIPSDKTFTFEVGTKRKEDHDLGLTIDGQITVILEYNDKIKVHRSKRGFYMIKFKDQDYYKTLREKIGWGKAATQ